VALPRSANSSKPCGSSAAKVTGAASPASSKRPCTSKKGAKALCAGGASITMALPAAVGKRQ
jgi:hypothetical protein